LIGSRCNQEAVLLEIETFRSIACERLEHLLLAKGTSSMPGHHDCPIGGDEFDARDELEEHALEEHRRELSRD